MQKCDLGFAKSRVADRVAIATGGKSESRMSGKSLSDTINTMSAGLIGGLAIQSAVTVSFSVSVFVSVWKCACQAAWRRTAYLSVMGSFNRANFTALQRVEIYDR